MRLVICDGNRILGEALAAALEACDHEVTAVAATGAEDCIAAVAAHRPDICMLDVHLPGPEDGLAVIGKIGASWPGTAIVILSSLSDPAIWARIKGTGVAGILRKDRSVSEIADALHVISRGKPVFDAAPAQKAPRPAAAPALRPREAEVLRRITAGQHTQQMAYEMNIAVGTLRTYVKNVFTKLGVHSRLEAAAVASRLNLLGEMPNPPSSMRDEKNISHSA
jgi:two-component system, NarL family, nitrate/nitrite response regulator NarL